ncbi:MAG: 30S ribosomal protein S6 [Bryobacteraceae bacterium]
MRIYEELFIVRPDATDEEIDPLVEHLKAIITGAQGTVEKLDKWGVRKLAYRVSKRSEGYYILIQFSAGPEAVREIERRLRVSSDLVMKFITVRIDERLKKIDKRKKAREKRAHRKPAIPVAAPALPATPAAAAPGAPAPPAEPAVPIPGEPVAGHE